MKPYLMISLIAICASTCTALTVTDGLVLHLDAGEIQGVGDGSAIGIWEDLSGAGNDALQTSVANQPVYVAESEAFDGQPAIRFNGTDTWIDLENSLVNTGSFTFIAVARFNTTTVNQYLVTGGGQARLRIAIDAYSDDVFEYRAGNSGWKQVTAPADTETHAFALTSTVEGFLDGESLGTTSNTSALVPEGFNIGSMNRGSKDFFDGDVAIVALYNRVLTDDEIAELSDTLMSQAVSASRLVVSRPYPVDNAEDVWLGDRVLKWTGWEFSQGLSPRHRVLISDSWADVNDGLVSPIELDVNSLTLTEELAYGTTYYWRVEEANSLTDWDAGPVWSFTTEPYAYALDGNSITATASSIKSVDNGPEKTIDGSGLDEDLHSLNSEDMWVSSTSDPGPVTIAYQFDQVYCLDEILIWNSNQLYEDILGFGVQDALIETSLDGSTWTPLDANVVIDQAPGTDGASVSTVIDCDEVLASDVRITCLSNYGGGSQYSLSEVRFMTIPIYARLPQPEDDATEVAIASQLGWRPGRNMETQELYLSADEDEVTLRTALVATTAGASLETGDLGIAYNQTYYWCVDSLDGDQLYEGPVWNYSTPEYLSLETFDDYATECTHIYWFWRDGAGYDGSEDCDVPAYAGNGSSPTCYVGYYSPDDNGSFAETSVVYAGAQSMPFDYDNTVAPYVSEAQSKDGLLASDWTVGGVENLTLYFKGNPADVVEVSEDNLIVSGAGSDIFGTSDEFRYVYKSLNGDGTMVARVVSLDNTDGYAKAGLMIRAHADEADSTNVLVYVSPENGLRIQNRSSSGGSTSSDTSTASDEQKTVTAPIWLKLERVGNEFSAYYSTDEMATNWIAASGNPVTVPMVTTVSVGLAVCSHASGLTTVAEFTDIEITGSVSGSWTAEAVGVEQPVNSAEPLYVKVTDGATQSASVQYEDAAATQIGVWTQWDIPLSDLSSAGVDLTDVKNLTIGVGDGSSSTGGTGTMLIDEIRLTRPVD